MPSQEPSLDEIQWSSPATVMNEYGSIHSNTVLFYFSHSPFFAPTSNNAILFNQAMHNQSMHQLLTTREAFEGRLRTMSGLEFMVVEEPAVMGPGAGTGVWVINRQVRKKVPGGEDEVRVEGTYFVVGINIYQAPVLGDIVNSRVALVSTAMRSIIDLASSIRTWTPSKGPTYLPPVPAKDLPTAPTTSLHDPQQTLQSEALGSLLTHLRHSTDYLNENPITGEPGKFQLSSTGRSAAAARAALAAAEEARRSAEGGNTLSSVVAQAAPGTGTGSAPVGGKKEDGKKEGGKEKRTGQKVKKRRTKSTASTPAVA